MRVSLTVLVRMTIFGFLGLSLVAITVGRMFPEGSNGRRLRGYHETQVNSFAGPHSGSTPQFLDAESCNIRKLVLPRGDRLINARCSPWVDENGESQVVGQWSSFSATEDKTQIGTMGLARFRFPSGEPLDRIEADVYPASPPCWLPGTSARVLFAAGDGRLYRLDFEGDRPAVAGSAPGRPEPVQLTWNCPVPGEGSVTMGDPFWVGSTDRDNRVYVSLHSQVRRDGRMVSTPAAIWWLKLDLETSGIVDAGPVFTEGGDVIRHRRFPTVASRAGLGTVIAHLSRGIGERGWKLEVAPLHVDPATGNPSAALADLKMYAEGCAMSSPAFSSGGQWISCIFRHDGEPPRGLRLEVPESVFSPAAIW